MSGNSAAERYHSAMSGGTSFAARISLVDDAMPGCQNETMDARIMDTEGTI